MPEVKLERSILLWLVAIGFFMEILDATIVNTALPTMAEALNTRPLNMQSIIIAYTLTLAVLIPVSGWLTDRFGVRNVYISAIGIFTLGSLFCALSTSLTELVISRVVQGIGGSMLLPVGRLAVLRAFPGKLYLPALSFVTVPALIAPLIGPTLGGWIVQYTTWHWIFLINIPIGVAGCFATWKYMEKDETDDGKLRRFDLIGFIQVAIFMVGMSVALDGLSEFSLSRGVVFLLIVLSLACLVSYGFHTVKTPYPLVSLSLFKVKSYSIGLIGNMFSRIGSTCMPFLIPLFLQLCLGYTPFQAGLSMLPIAVAALLAKWAVSPLINKMGYKHFLILNTLFVGLSIASFSIISPSEPVWLRAVQLFIFGAVNSMQFTAMNTLTMKDVDKKKSADGNAMYSMVQMLALSFSVAAAGSLVSAFATMFEKIVAFQITFICMGIVTCISAWIFAQVEDDIEQ
jgi:EmrB/QacA subfamily drug resistance transporter